MKIWWSILAEPLANLYLLLIFICDFLKANNSAHTPSRPPTLSRFKLAIQSTFFSSSSLGGILLAFVLNLRRYLKLNISRPCQPLCSTPSPLARSLDTDCNAEQ
ncbi:hypothetical protein B0H19DRAFT_1124249 [Mycena capillaripes]|nr:hypothetical protein B0H19DRAFT_1124249 [Mycena capillaripes]